jgi:undecaprenyl-diphosphatase
VTAVIATAVFAALTVAVTAGSRSLGLDSSAFDLARDVREPWLDHFFRVVTTLGLIGVVGPAVLLGAALLIRRRQRSPALALVVGATLAWAGTWLTKGIVDRPRPPAPIVHTAGQSYPSSHAANSVGWLAIAIAISVLVPSRPARVAAITAGALIAALVGLSRIYLRAHYASDVLGGESLAVAMYAFAGIVVQLRRW